MGDNMKMNTCVCYMILSDSYALSYKCHDLYQCMPKTNPIIF